MLPKAPKNKNYCDLCSGRNYIHTDEVNESLSIVCLSLITNETSFFLYSETSFFSFFPKLYKLILFFFLSFENGLAYFPPDK
jgi:hypothetical protein